MTKCKQVALANLLRHLLDERCPGKSRIDLGRTELDFYLVAITELIGILKNQLAIGDPRAHGSSVRAMDLGRGIQKRDAKAARAEFSFAST